MKTKTIRGVEPDLATQLKQAASDQKKSLNQLVLDILKTSLGMKKEKNSLRKYDDLDLLFGRWTEREYNSIQGKIDQERQIGQFSGRYPG